MVFFLSCKRFMWRVCIREGADHVWFPFFSLKKTVSGLPYDLISYRSMLKMFAGNPTTTP